MRTQLECFRDMTGHHSEQQTRNTHVSREHTATRTAGLIHYDPHLTHSHGGCNQILRVDAQLYCLLLQQPRLTMMYTTHLKRKTCFIWKAQKLIMNPWTLCQILIRLGGGQTGNGRKLTERTGRKQHGPEHTASHGGSLDTLAGSPNLTYPTLKLTNQILVCSWKPM